jgi:hypothetical protein
MLNKESLHPQSYAMSNAQLEKFTSTVKFSIKKDNFHWVMLNKESLLLLSYAQ